jgi:hypothetical protein
MKGLLMNFVYNVVVARGEYYTNICKIQILHHFKKCLHLKLSYLLIYKFSSAFTKTYHNNGLGCNIGMPMFLKYLLVDYVVYFYLRLKAVEYDFHVLYDSSHI